MSSCIRGQRIQPPPPNAKSLFKQLSAGPSASEQNCAKFLQNCVKFGFAFQSHYDFGMRAIKAVLIMAGQRRSQLLRLRYNFFFFEN